jgi:hypothetical protein
VARKVHKGRTDVLRGFIAKNEPARSLVIKLTECDMDAPEQDIMRRVLYRVWEISSGAPAAKPRINKGFINRPTALSR